MSVTIDQDLKDILSKLDQKFDKIDQKFDRLDQKIDNIHKEVVDLKIGQIKLEGEIKTLDEKLTNKIDKVEIKLSEKVDGLTKRVDNTEFTARAIVIGIGVIILGGAAKLFGFIPPLS